MTRWTITLLLTGVFTSTGLYAQIDTIQRYGRYSDKPIMKGKMRDGKATEEWPADTLKIIAGQGIDNIIIGKSTQKDVKNFKHVKFAKDKGIGHNYGTWGSHPSSSSKWVKYQNDSLGLTFNFTTFSARRPFFLIFRKMRLCIIKITKNAMTADHLVIGKSTRQDVMSLYEPLPDLKDKSSLHFADRGIAFTFDSNGVLIAINIFEPHNYHGKP